MPDPDTPKPEPERGTGPVVILTPRQLLGVFVLCAILGAATFPVNHVVGSVFLSLAVAVALFGFLGGVAHVENRWGKFGGSAGGFVATLLILLEFGSPPIEAVEIKGMVYVDGQPATKGIVTLLETSFSDNRREISEGNPGLFEFRGVPGIGDKVKFRIDVDKPVDLNPGVSEHPVKAGKLIVIKLATPDALVPVPEARPTALTPMLAMAPAPLGEKFVGRAKELAELDQAWQSLWNGTSPAQRIVAVVAWGGFGKTALVRQWLYLKDKRGWPGGPAPDGIFWWTFGKTADADGFLNDAIAYFAGKAPEPGALQSDYQKLGALRKAIGDRRFLLVFDGLEAVQRGARGEDFGKTAAPLLASILKELASGKLGTGLSLITSRLPLTDLADLRDGSVGEIPLEQRPLELVDARLLLKLEGVTNATDPERDAIIEWCGRHPLALRTLAGILQNHNGGKASGWERFVTEDKLVQPPAGREAERQLWRILHWYDTNLTRKELRVMSVLANFREPVAGTWVEQLFVNNGELAQGLLRQPGELRSALDRLVQFRLLERAPGAEIRYALHPLLGEHFRTLTSEADRRAIHNKLYHYYSETVQPEFQPNTLDGLRPLYEAVYHGCKAELYQETLTDVYVARILRGTGDGGFYSTTKLGAYGTDLEAVACFFKERWKRLAPGISERGQAWLLNQAAFHLRALGRLTESLEPMRASVTMSVQQQDWEEAAVCASNLSELELTLGDVAAAIRDAEQSVQFANRSNDSFQRIGKRTTLADARHQSGARADALALFREAEAMQAQQQPQYPLLYSLQGFRYCDLLLDGAERMAWATTLLSAPAAMDTRPLQPQLDGLKEVEQRAAKLFEWHVPQDPLLDIALDRLTLGRVALYRAIQQDSSFEPAREPLFAAVDGLRAAGTMDYVPRGLLIRAWLRFMEGDPDGAKADLDEAWQIAERGSMKLHMADILLHRARLFRDRAALEGASKLIAETGYHRRDAELADAREALNHPQR
ncbi:MAG: hypothetical protein ACREXX_13010 [Gammaproteobacteria bacterium]